MLYNLHYISVSDYSSIVVCFKIFSRVSLLGAGVAVGRVRRCVASYSRGLVLLILMALEHDVETHSHRLQPMPAQLIPRAIASCRIAHSDDAPRAAADEPQLVQYALAPRTDGLREWVVVVVHGAVVGAEVGE